VRQLFGAGSVSKVFTATAVMQQVQEGQLDLDTDVRSYLDFPLELPKGPVTLRHLLSDTAGFEKWPLVDVSRPPEPQPDLRAELTAHPPRQTFPRHDTGLLELRLYAGGLSGPKD
jgi:CubicO group peptidase (beta-lactamase class C family)